METDAAIVRRAIEGDDRAMRLLWHQHSPHVDAVVRRLAGDADLAEDIAQEVWIQIFRALPSWRGDAKFSTWVHRVAVNRAWHEQSSVGYSRRLSKRPQQMRWNEAMSKGTPQGMQHLDSERLAALDHDVPSSDELGHLAVCRVSCGTRGVRRVVGVGAALGAGRCWCGWAAG